MQVELAGWETSGLRCPDVKIDLTQASGEPARIALVQMPNGTGKTTMLTLLFATLSGTASSWSAEKIAEYQKRGGDNDRGNILVHLLVDSKRLSIELILDFVSGVASYRTTTPGSGGLINRWSVPPSLHRFLSEEFLRLFIFDGEFAEDLLDPKRHEASKAIDALCQVYLLDEVRDFADTNWEEATKRRGPTTQAGLQRLIRRKDQINTRLETIAKALNEGKEEQAKTAERLDQLENLIDRRIASVERIRESHSEATTKVALAKEQVGIATTQLLSSIRVPSSVHPTFAKQLRTLLDSLDRLRLPENTSAQFFAELLEEDDCICGRPLDASARQAISERSHRYLDTDEAGTLNALKRDIDTYVPSDTDVEVGYRELLQRRNQLSSAVRARDTAATEVRTLLSQLIAAGDDDLKALQDEQLSLETKAEQLEKLLGKISGPGDPTTDIEQELSSSRLEAELETTQAQISEITETVRLRKQTSLLNQIMSRAAEIARESIRADLVNESNNLLSRVLAQSPVTIESIDRSIRLKDQVGASMGQTLSVGYVFLLSILRRGKSQFPLVVDSPANPMDLGVRREVAKLIPRLSSQFVAFTINTEREGFVDTLVQEHPDSKLITLFRITDASKHLLQSLPSGHSTVSADAAIIMDRDFFFEFDIGEESDGI